MDFIREKIKEKPINKRRLALRVGVSALCGLAFAITVCIVLVIAGPLIREDAPVSGSETESDTQSESTEDTQGVIVLPPDLNLSISEYQELQNLLFPSKHHR